LPEHKLDYQRKLYDLDSVSNDLVLKCSITVSPLSYSRPLDAVSRQTSRNSNYVFFLRFSYMLQKPQGNQNGRKSHIYQVLRLIFVMYFCNISS